MKYLGQFILDILGLTWLCSKYVSHDNQLGLDMLLRNLETIIPIQHGCHK